MSRGSGSIEKRGAHTWRVRVYLGEDQNGRRINLNKTVKGLRRDAERVLQDLLQKKNQGRLCRPIKMSVSEFLSKWQSELQSPSLRPNTKAFYARLCSRYIEPSIGWRRVDQLTPLDIQLLVNNMVEQGLSSRTVRATVGCVRTALRTGIRLQMLNHDPTLNVELPRHQKARETSVMNKEEASKFIRACKEERLGPYFIMALATAGRPSEIAALKWQDIDLDAGTVSIARSMTRIDGKVIFHAPKTITSNRTLALSKSVVLILRCHRRRQLEEKLKAGEKWKDHDLVFTDLKGKPLNLPNVRRRDLQKITKKAGITKKKLTLYALRHTSASLLIANGVDPKTASEVMGHSDVALVLSVYTHPEQESKRYAASVLEDLVFCNVQG